MSRGAAGGSLFELFFVARVRGAQGERQAQNGAGAAAPAGGGGQQRSALACRFVPPGGGAAVPADDNIAGFCWPLGVDAVRPSAYLVTAEFSFTLTGGDGSRLHGVCRRTHDPTFRAAPPPPRPSPGARSANAAGLEQKRMPQVICILSQHCWLPFFSKVLEIADQLLAPHAGAAELPPDSPAALFLASLPRVLAAAGPPLPPLGAVLRVPLPYSAAPISVDRMRRALAAPGRPAGEMTLGLWPDAIELEVPPELGNGAANAGVSLARLLWFLTPRQAVTLVASLLLERRIILVARDAETVSAAVHAANALLYPFRWQHIYLPLLPLSLKDYLAAPMPYLVGIQADCLPLLRGMAGLEDTVMIDLDRLGSCTPELGSPGDDYFLLPFARELEDVFEVVREHIQSPTEFDSTPKCTELVQDFFLRLVGNYRKFVRADEDVPPAALAIGLDRPLGHGSGGPGSATPNGSVGSRASSKNGAAPEDENPRAHGFVFDQAAFVQSHKRKDKITAFLNQFRNSQMLEVFITERLRLASEGYVTDDPFEQKVAERNTRQGVRLGIPGVGSVPLPAVVGTAGKAVVVGTSSKVGKVGSLLRKGVTAVKQGGVGLADSFKRLGSTQQEAELQIAGRSHSGPNLGRSSPGAHGLGLTRRSPGIAPTSLVAHSRGNSFSSSRASSRSNSYTNMAHLARPSANLAALNGGVQPSLEQLRPDMFFGADDEEDDDSSSVASRTSQPDAAWSGAGRPSGVASTGVAAGPLAAALAKRSFGSLFHPPSASSPASISASPPPQHQSPASASPLGSRVASTSRLGTTDAHEQGPVQLPAPDLGFLLGSAAAGAAAGAAVASPATLYDLTSPAGQQKPPPHPHLARSQQQLFADASAAAAAGQRAAHSRSSSAGGWATFDDPAEPPFGSEPFGSPQAGSGAAPPSFSPAFDSGMSPLGSGMSAMLAGGSRLSPAAASPPSAAAARGPAVAAREAEQQQQDYSSRQQQQSWATWQQQDRQPEQPPPLSPYQPEPAWTQQQQQHQQQPPWSPQQQQQQQPWSSQQQQQAAQARSLQRTPSQQEQHTPPRPPPPPADLAGVTTGWAPYGHECSAAASHPGQATPQVPVVCRQSAHSPLAAGFATVHRLASLGHVDVARRSSTSSTGAGSSSVASGGSQPGQSSQDGFAGLAATAAADASHRVPSRQHSSSSWAGPEGRSAPRLTHSSSWAEYSQAAPPPGAYPGGSFEPMPLGGAPVGGAWQPRTSAGEAHAHVPEGPLSRQLTASTRTSSWGEWAGGPAVPPPAGSASILANGLGSLRLH